MAYPTNHVCASSDEQPDAAVSEAEVVQRWLAVCPELARPSVQPAKSSHLLPSQQLQFRPTNVTRIIAILVVLAAAAAAGWGYRYPIVGAGWFAMAYAVTLVLLLTEWR